MNVEYRPRPRPKPKHQALGAHWALGIVNTEQWAQSIKNSYLKRHLFQVHCVAHCYTRDGTEHCLLFFRFFFLDDDSKCEFLISKSDPWMPFIYVHHFYHSFRKCSKTNTEIEIPVPIQFRDFTFHSVSFCFHWIKFNLFGICHCLLPNGEWNYQLAIANCQLPIAKLNNVFNQTKWEAKKKISNDSYPPSFFVSRFWIFFSRAILM